jgi:exopolysaccharide production protein ExoQ
VAHLRATHRIGVFNLDIKLLKYLGTKIEPVVTLILMVYFLVPGLGPPPLDSFMRLISYPLVAILVLGQWKRFLYVSTRNIPLLLLIVMAFVSILWSAAPLYTSDESKALIRATAFGAYLATRHDFKGLMKLWTWAFGITIFLSFIVNMRPINEAWTGIFSYKNHLARMMTYAAILMQTNTMKSGKLRWLAQLGFYLSIALTFLSQSKSGYVFFCVMLLIFPLYNLLKMHYKIRVIFLFSILLAAGSAILLLIFNLEIFIVDILGKDLTLNGRTQIWGLMFEKVSQRPWTGYGYSGFWTSNEAEYIYRNSWAYGATTIEGFRFNSHNSFMELLLQVGVPGLSLYLFSYLLTFSRTVNLLKSTRDSLRKIEIFWILQNLCAMFLFSWSDSGGVLGNDSIWAFYVCIALRTGIECKRIREKNLSHSYLIEQNMLG